MDNRYFSCGEDQPCCELDEDIKRIYDYMIDDESKFIFSRRLLYNYTKDYRYIRDIIDSTNEGKRWEAALDRYGSHPIYIYGAGTKGYRLLHLYPDKNWGGYIDKNKSGQTYNGLHVFGLDKCAEFSDSTIIISNFYGSEIISEELIGLGVDKERIISINDMEKDMLDKQYFDDISVDGEKTFVDVGSYDGQDTIRYLKWIDNYDARVMAIEADPGNYNNCFETLKRYKGVELVHCGIADTNGVLRFAPNNGQTSSFSEEGSVKVEIKSLDELLQDREIGYIKMDIEGFEKRAIIGAEGVLKSQHPVLAVSIYHKRDDIWELPNAILNADSTYRFYLRHYTLGVTDTVLYAV